MISNENSIGKPLAAANWLKAHHIAKLTERTTFAKKLATFNPRNVVDLGCASGLWLELLNQILPTECEFIGIDSDPELLHMAAQRGHLWNRKVSFFQLDLEKDVSKIPSSDLTLAFNIFPYIKNLESFIETLFHRTHRGILAVRQYDGASIRFGPMPTSKRQAIETELRIATENSDAFHHYDLDRTYNVLRHSSYKNQLYDFELFKRVSPFPADFLPYYQETMDWTCQFLSKDLADYFRKWIEEDPLMRNRYFFEVDLVAILS